MNLTEFMGLLNGEYKETAGTTAKNQCVDLANAYIRYVLRLPIIEWTNAVDFPSKASDNYEYILNTPNGIPQEGDLVIWGGNQYGHIAIFIEGDTNTFRSFDENYPTGSPCHVQEHNYDSPKVLGWLRVKSAIITPPTTQELTDQTIIPAILLGQSLPLEIQQIRGLLGDFRRCREELNTVEEDKENLIGQLKGSMQALENEMNLNVKLANKLKECESKPHSIPETPNEHTSYDTGADALVGLIQSFITTLKKIFSK